MEREGTRVLIRSECYRGLDVTCLVCSMLCFFFSSRRRHTRLQGDWSSDVCSSDLRAQGLAEFAVVVPALMGAVFTIIGIGFWLYAQLVVAGAAQEGARVAAREGATLDRKSVV